jgi:hypothetical protein
MPFVVFSIDYDGCGDLLVDYVYKKCCAQSFAQISAFTGGKIDCFLNNQFINTTRSDFVTDFENKLETVVNTRFPDLNFMLERLSRAKEAKEKFIKSLENLSVPGKTIVFCGSNRQSPSFDALLAESDTRKINNKAYYAHQELKHFTQQQGWQYNPLLLSTDKNNYVIEIKIQGFKPVKLDLSKLTSKKMLTIVRDNSNESVQIKAGAAIKVALVQMQLDHLAKNYQYHPVDYHFYDDREEFFSSIIDLVKVPSNIRLICHKVNYGNFINNGGAVSKSLIVKYKQEKIGRSYHELNKTLEPMRNALQEKFKILLPAQQLNQAFFKDVDDCLREMYHKKINMGDLNDTNEVFKLSLPDFASNAHALMLANKTDIQKAIELKLQGQEAARFIRKKITQRVQKKDHHSNADCDKNIQPLTSISSIPYNEVHFVVSDPTNYSTLNDRYNKCDKIIIYNENYPTGITIDATCFSVDKEKGKTLIIPKLSFYNSPAYKAAQKAYQSKNSDVNAKITSVQNNKK